MSARLIEKFETGGTFCLKLFKVLGEVRPQCIFSWKIWDPQWQFFYKHFKLLWRSGKFYWDIWSAISLDKYAFSVRDNLSTNLIGEKLEVLQWHIISRFLQASWKNYKGWQFVETCLITFIILLCDTFFKT